MADPAEATGLGAAADRIRETSKWLTVSLASIGGVLIAGSQLSDLGALELGSLRMQVSIVALASASIMTGLILGFNIWVATTPAHSITFLADEGKRKPKGVDAILGDSAFLGGLRTAGDLERKFQQALEEQQAAYDAIADPANLDPKEVARIQSANAGVTSYSQTVQGLLLSVSYAWLSWRWKIAGTVLILGGLVTAGCIATYAWAVHPGETAKASMASPAVAETPNAIMVMLNQEGQRALSPSLGCDTYRLLAGLKLADTPAGPDILVIRQSDGTCKPTRFVASTAWAVISPSN